MIKLISINIFCFILLVNGVYSQHIISGFITSAESGEDLINAIVELKSVDNNKIKHTITNSYGFYTISVPEGTYEFKTTYIGYKPKSFSLYIKNDTVINLSLFPSILNEVVITAKSSGINLQDKVESGHINLNIEKIKTIPSLTGEPDILKALSLIPGINLGVEGSSSLYVRGGTPDQNFILLDDAPVYNPAHLFGFISVFNGDAINDFDVWKSSFPARYGGRLSSIIDIKMKEGNKNKYNTKFRLGILSSGILNEGPITKNSSYIFSMRSSYFDIITYPLKIKYNAGNSSNYFNYRMYDLNAKINYVLKDKSKLFLSFYKGGDHINIKQKFSKDENISDFKWNNNTLTTRYFKQLKSNLFLNTILYYSDYNQKYAYSENLISEKTSFMNNLNVHEFGYKLKFEMLLFNNHYLKYGGNIIKRFYKPIDMSYVLTKDMHYNKILTYSNNEFASFIEDEIKLSKNISSNVGLRISGIRQYRKYYWDVEPRISCKLNLMNSYSLKLSFSKMKQYINWGKAFEGSLPFDIWLPSTDKLPPQTAYHFNLGIDKTFADKNIDFSLDIYYKKMNNLIETKDNESTFLLLFNKDSLYQIVANKGIGNAYGMELFLYKKTGKFTGWISYSLAKNTRKFSEINYNKDYPFVYDRRHDFSISLQYYLNKKISILGTWVYHTGDAVTLPIASYYNEKGEYKYIYGSKNSYRYPPYHRLDVGLNWNWASHGKKHKKRQFQFNIYNLYNRRNAFLITPYTKIIRDNKGKIVRKEYKMIQKSFLPILPSFSYVIEL